MKTIGRWVGAPAVATLVAALVSAPLRGQVDYSRAERMLTWHASLMVSGDEVDPHWMPDGSRFWYRNKLAEGAEFVLVDPVRRNRRLVFDNARLAAAMSLAGDTAWDPVKLPFRSFDFVDREQAIEFRAGAHRYHCVLATYGCTLGDTLPDRRGYVVSPDSTWEAFIHEYNVFIRPRGGGDSTALTTDGVKYWSYGRGELRPRQQLQKASPGRPNLRWSPDSRRIAVSRTDQRDVQHMHYISYTSQRPRHFSQPYALPGDTVVPLPSVHILDIDSRSNVTARLPDVPNQLRLGGTPRDSVWTADSDGIDLLFLTRASKKMYLVRVDAETGESRILAADSSDTWVETNPRDAPAWFTTDDGEVIWWSERDGWAHLYRYDANGTLLNRITSGPWTVSTVKHVDQAARQIYFTARGREPGRFVYHQYLYRVNFDGTGLTLLTPEDGDHDLEFSPDGRSIVDRVSRRDAPPVASVRSPRDGAVVMPLETADVSALEAIGWSPGEVFRVKARDGITDIYGIMYRPSDFDSTRRYPVIDHIYPGPQVGSVRGWGFSTGGEARALAELGFIVVEIDHLGTPLRSRAFHENYYGDFIDNGIPDHIAGIRQLAVRHRYLDLDRVGIYGHSGGGFASTDAILRFPDFYKVAVSGAGNHDNRSYNIYWAEKYQGLLTRDSTGRDNFAASANKTYAKNLRGKLLLMHGDMDDNVHPANTIQLVDALIKANKDFDLIIAPDRGHGLNEPYFIRRRWDYFVRYLMGEEPPHEYRITRPKNGPPSARRPARP